MSSGSEISVALTRLVEELVDRTGLSYSEVLGRVKLYLCEYIGESLKLRRDLIALLRIERHFKKRFRKSEFNCYDFVSEDRRTLVKIVDELVVPVDYARKHIKELAELFQMEFEGKEVYLLLHHENSYDLLRLDEFLSQLSLPVLNRIIELSKRRVFKGRKPTEIPLELVQEKLKDGWTFRKIYQFLVKNGYLRYMERGEERVLTYKQFCYRLNKLGISRVKKKREIVPLIICEKEKLLEAYEEFRRITEKKHWKNLNLFISFLVGKRIIPKDNINRELIHKKLMILLRNEFTKGD